MLMGDGIISDISQFSVPWNDIDYIPSLDVGYYWHSAQKLVSPLVLDICNHSDLSELTNEDRTKIAGTIFNMFNRKWSKLWNVFLSEYNPLHNYTMEETETIDRDVSRSGSDGGTVNTSNTGTIADATTNGGTIKTDTSNEITNTGTQINNGTNNTEEGIFGFNSSNSVGSNTSDNDTYNKREDNLKEEESKTVTETRNTTDNNTRTLNTVDLETRNLTHSDTESDDSTKSITREGTTGIYTPQQLLIEEIDFLQRNYFKQVFEDIDSILCLSVY